MSTTQLTWKTNFWKSKCTIYSDNTQIGYLNKTGWWPGNKKGKLHDKELTFKFNGGFPSTVDVLEYGEKVGEISINYFLTKISFNYLGETFTWSRKGNIFKSTWQFHKERELCLSLRFYQIEVPTQNNGLVLVALYILTHVRTRG